MNLHDGVEGGIQVVIFRLQAVQNLNREGSTRNCEDGLNQIKTENCSHWRSANGAIKLEKCIIRNGHFAF